MREAEKGALPGGHRDQDRGFSLGGLGTGGGGSSPGTGGQRRGSRGEEGALLGITARGKEGTLQGGHGGPGRGGVSRGTRRPEKGPCPRPSPARRPQAQHGGRVAPGYGHFRRGRDGGRKRWSRVRGRGKMAAPSAAGPGPAPLLRVIAECGRSRARAGELRLPHGPVPCPVFMPVGTRGTAKGVTAAQLAALGCRICLGNTYHLGTRPVSAAAAGGDGGVGEDGGGPGGATGMRTGPARSHRRAAGTGGPPPRGGHAPDRGEATPPGWPHPLKTPRLERPHPQSPCSHRGHAPDAGRPRPQRPHSLIGHASWVVTPLKTPAPG